MPDIARNHASAAMVAAAVLMFMAACSVGPNYKRPGVNVPGSYRGETESNAPSTQPPGATATVPSGIPLGEEKWWEVFQDQVLQQLIHTALQNNYDVRIAATRVLQAQAQLGITRANQYPTLTGGGSVTSIRDPTIGPIPAYEITLGQVSATASWNVDFWGQYRRATEAARATLLANEWAQKAVISTLVSDVASSYFLLRQLDLQLEISKSTLASRQDSLGLTKMLEEHGMNSLLDVRQSEQLVYTASAEIPDLERQIEQQENAISILLGNNPANVPRGLKLTEEPHAPEVPVGLPSSLLERRPDIREAEENLVAANAQIGVARAAYFPQITLTGNAGYESPKLTDLFQGPAGVWT
jgi:outer membrane protein, multidrug efflux system